MVDAFKTDVIQKSVTYTDLGLYLIAEYGHDLAVWIDGTVDIIESNTRYRDNDDAPIARARCPGIGNLDSTVFSNGYAERDESGIYFEIKTGRRIGDLIELIRESCAQGDMSSFYDDLIDKLYESTE